MSPVCCFQVNDTVNNPVSTRRGETHLSHTKPHGNSCYSTVFNTWRVVRQKSLHAVYRGLTTYCTHTQQDEIRHQRTIPCTSVRRFIVFCFICHSCTCTHTWIYIYTIYIEYKLWTRRHTDSSSHPASVISYCCALQCRGLSGFSQPRFPFRRMTLTWSVCASVLAMIVCTVCVFHACVEWKVCLFLFVCVRVGMCVCVFVCEVFPYRFVGVGGQ